MSDVAQGPGWWQASDGRWYPPEALAQALEQARAGQPVAGGGSEQPPSGGGVGGGPGAGGGPGVGVGHVPVGAAPAHTTAHTHPLDQAGQAPAGGGVPGPAPGDAGQAPGFPPYGPGPSPQAAPYPWPAYAAYPSWRRNRVIGALLVVLGLAGVVWGIGELYAAMALNSSPVYPHDEQVGAWLLTAGILLASLVTVVIGLVYRRD